MNPSAGNRSHRLPALGSINDNRPAQNRIRRPQVLTVQPPPFRGLPGYAVPRTLLANSVVGSNWPSVEGRWSDQSRGRPDEVSTVSLRPRGPGEVPEQTAEVGRLAFPLRIREVLGLLFHDEDFADLYPRRGQPAGPPGQLATVSIPHPSPHRAHLQDHGLQLDYQWP